MLFADRVHRAKNKAVSSTEGVVSTGGDTRKRPVYKQWTEAQMSQALHAVITSEMSIRSASLQFSVPKSTLGDRVSEIVQPGAVSGPPTYLSLAEEHELVTFLLRSCQIGYARSRLEIIALVQRIVDSKGMDRTITHGWWDSFRKRHPQVVLRAPVSVSHVRSKATDPEVIMRYFDLLEVLLLFCLHRFILVFWP